MEYDDEFVAMQMNELDKALEKLSTRKVKGQTSTAGQAASPNVRTLLAEKVLRNKRQEMERMSSQGQNDFQRNSSPYKPGTTFIAHTQQCNNVAGPSRSIRPFSKEKGIMPMRDDEPSTSRNSSLNENLMDNSMTNGLSTDQLEVINFFQSKRPRTGSSPNLQQHCFNLNNLRKPSLPAILGNSQQEMFRNSSLSNLTKGSDFRTKGSHNLTTGELESQNSAMNRPFHNIEPLDIFSGFDFDSLHK